MEASAAHRIPVILILTGLDFFLPSAPNDIEAGLITKVKKTRESERQKAVVFGFRQEKNLLAGKKRTVAAHICADLKRHLRTSPGEERRANLVFHHARSDWCKGAKKTDGSEQDDWRRRIRSVSGVDG
jgi:hypothetical protein